MLKYIKFFFKGGYKILLRYPKIYRYAKHKEKYSLEERYAYARKLVKIFFKAFDIKVNVYGFEQIKDEAYLFISNHQGVIDALTYMYLSEKPITFVSKKEALKYPFVGKVIYFIDGVFLDRDNIRDAVKMVKTCANSLNNGTSVCIFPEGTRTRDENQKIGEYKAGALKCAYEAKKKIVSFMIDGGYKVFSKKYKKNFKIDVKILEVIDPSVYLVKSTTDLANEIKEKTQEELIKIRQQ